MAQLPANPKDITHLIWQALEAKQEGPRSYLGMSELGGECERAIWYSFRHAAQKKFPGRVLALFGRGHREEAQINDKLKMIGVQVVEFDENGKQFQFVGYKGHVKGHMDAALHRVPEAPQTWHVGEYKTHSDKSFQDVKKNGVEKSKPQHFAQMQLYMGYSEMDRALYVAVNKNDDDIYTERVHFDKAVFDKLLAKAERIVDAGEPPEKLSQDPSWYQCKFCDYHSVCHGTAVPLANCRTCARSTPVDDGKWNCELKQVALNCNANFKDVSETPCNYHLYIPALIGTPVDGGEEHVEYEGGVINATKDAAEGNAYEGKTVLTSKQMEEAGDKQHLAMIAEFVK
jgi:CRISPR/Cas system-associated exonuclease Cas4 (RecB family)